MSNEPNNDRRQVADVVAERIERLIVDGVLKVGQALFLQGPAASVAQKKGNAPTYYKVQKGDSLYQIAKRFNVQLTNLKTWNKGADVLRPGQLLTLYLPN